MIFPIISRQGTTSTSTLYGNILGNYSTSWDATIGNAEQVAAIAGTLTNYLVVLGTAPGGSASYTFTVQVNGVDTAMAVTITGASTTGSYSGSVSFNAGDRLVIKSTSASTPATGMYFHAIDVEAAGQILLTGGAGTLNNAAARYFAIQASSIYSATTALAVKMPTDGTLRNHRVRLAASPGVGTSYTFTLVKNGVDTAVVISVAGTNTDGSDTSNSVSVVATDTVYWRVDPVSTPTARRCSISSEFSPSIDGESIQTAYVGSNLVASGNNYAGIMAGPSISYSSTETNRVGYIGPATYIAKKLYATVDAAPGSGKSWAVTLRNNAGNTALSVSIADAATSNQDTATSVTLTPSTLTGFGIVPSGTPTATTGTYSFVTYSPPASLGNFFLMF